MLHWSYTPEQKEEVKKALAAGVPKATKEGYPDVPSYCKDVVLNQRTYATLWNTVTKKIKSMPSEKTFVLRDLVDTPPSNLGVKLYNHQKELGIEVIKKDSMNTNMFKKL